MLISDYDCGTGTQLVQRLPAAGPRSSHPSRWPGRDFGPNREHEPVPATARTGNDALGTQQRLGKRSRRYPSGW